MKITLELEVKEMVSLASFLIVMWQGLLRFWPYIGPTLP